MNSGHRVVVTGGAGFIGGHLVERLAAARMGSILVLDNLYRPCVKDPRVWPAGVTFAHVDIRNRRAVSDALAGQDVVFHLAAQSNVMGAVSDAGYAFDTNVSGTFNLLEAAKSTGVKRFVFTSSREVYGEPERLPVPESAPLKPKNAYGASKVAGELYCRLAASEGLETVIVRLANVYGPRDRNRVIPLFVSAASAQRPMEIYGGDQVLDFVWVDVVVDALIEAAFGKWIGEPINIGSGKGASLVELAQRIVQTSGTLAPIRISPKRSEEVRRFVADITRGRQLLRVPSPADPLSQLPLLFERTVAVHA